MDATKEKIHLKKEQYLEFLLFKAFKEELPIAVWKKPKQNLVEIIIDDVPEKSKVSLDLDNLPPGFVVHPFIASGSNPISYIKATSYFSFQLDQDIVELEDANEAIKKQPDPLEVKFQILKFINAQESRRNEKSSNKQAFMKMVASAIEAIQAGKLFKVVPAKVKKINLDAEFDLAKTFFWLCEAYPNAFVNFFHSQETGAWIGASPETLIRTKGDLFYTMSLAGTQKAKGDNPLKNVAWTQKEIEEQALVSRYIVNCFKKIRLREYDEIGPKTTIAGGLLHLKSEFMVDMKATNFPQLGTVMLGLLHPTSAVCGMPREAAQEFIAQHENFDRSYFAGFLGPVNLGEETNIYVNLRCARLEGEKAWLYAGAGITEDSVPQKEWEETEMKCKIVGKFIQSKTKH